MSSCTEITETALTSTTQMVQIHANLYRQGNLKYYRLFAKGVTPNGCWLIAPMFRELKDIEAITGEDIYGGEEIQLGTGEIAAGYRYIEY